MRSIVMFDSLALGFGSVAQWRTMDTEIALMLSAAYAKYALG